MTTNELIKLVLEHDAKATRETYVRQRAATDGAVIAYADAVRTAAPLLARRLERAMEVLEGIYDGTYDAADSGQLLDEIEAMQ